MVEMGMECGKGGDGALFNVLRCSHQSGGAWGARARALLHKRAAGESGEGEVEETAIHTR